MGGEAAEQGAAPRVAVEPAAVPVPVSSRTDSGDSAGVLRCEGVPHPGAPQGARDGARFRAGGFREGSSSCASCSARSPDKRDLVAGGAATRDALVPYLELTQAVRLGDLEKFRAVTETRGAAFARDKTTNLIARLRRNVIRVGLRRVSLAYSAISLDDVAAKLGLAPGDDVERVVAKAIRDGGVDAVIDHEAGCMRSLETADVYSTREPQAAFHARIAFCLDAHNEAVRALRYPPAVKKGKGTDGGVSAKDLDALELELAMDDDDALDEF